MNEWMKTLYQKDEIKFINEGKPGTYTFQRQLLSTNWWSKGTHCKNIDMFVYDNLK